ncbi:MAG: ChaN family lipoprotein [Bdellovibrionales bacterium]
MVGLLWRSMPKRINSSNFKGGAVQLTPELKRWMPPNFTLGNALYKQRFEDVMKDHVPPEKLDNYFASQSVWDETMAWRVSEFIKNHDQHVFVIIVGDFHAAYFGGLPDRLKARGVENLIVLSQVDSRHSDQKEFEELIDPHPEYGPRADFILSVEQ